MNGNAVMHAKAAEVVAQVGLPAAGWIQIILSILQQVFAGGTGLGICNPPTTGGGGTPGPAPKPVLQAVQDPTEFHLLGLRGIVNHNVPQRSLRRPITEAIRRSGRTTTDDEVSAMYNYANGISTGDGGGSPVVQAE